MEKNLPLKGLYLLQEYGCLNPSSGAFNHISKGLSHLKKEYNIELYLGKELVDLKYHEKFHAKSIDSVTTSKKRGFIYGSLKDCQILLSSIFKILSIYRILKNENIDFVYERASYLNFSGLIAAKLAGVKHFYEVNNLFHKSMEDYYNSLLTIFVKFLEKWTYEHSNYNFFVGTYGDFWNLKNKNWINIENGIEREIIKRNYNLTFNEKIKLCFIGKPMSHHGINLLLEIYKDEKIRSNTSIHFIGHGFDLIIEKLKSQDVDVFEYGFLSRQKLHDLNLMFDLGLILNTPEYASNMKLFDYSALGCAVLSKRSHNLNYWFAKELFFHDGSVEDIICSLKRLILRRELIRDKAIELKDVISNGHTWDLIFYQKIQKINSIFKAK